MSDTDPWNLCFYCQAVACYYLRKQLANVLWLRNGDTWLKVELRRESIKTYEHWWYKQSTEDLHALFHFNTFLPDTYFPPCPADLTALPSCPGYPCLTLSSLTQNSSQSTVSHSVSRPTFPHENPESFLLEHVVSFLFLLLKVLITSPMLV